MTSEIVKPKVTKIYSIVYNVQSFTDPHKFYHVLVDKKERVPVACDCPAYEKGGQRCCKHMQRVFESIEYEDFVDKSENKEKLVASSWKHDQYDF